MTQFAKIRENRRFLPKNRLIGSIMVILVCMVGIWDYAGLVLVMLAVT
jgi:hypothetical protein